MPDYDQTIRAAAQAIMDADTLLITAGAGIGVDSGLPDFRGNQGFWNLYPAYGKRRLTFSDLANPMWFHQNPERAWGFYGYRYFLYRQAEPHRGFQILQKWLSRKSDPGFVYTSNVDGQFQKAGFSSDQIVECHGSIHYLQCLINCHERIWPTSGLKFHIDTEQFLAMGDLPLCPVCDGLARPNILMFGDGGWLSARTDLQRHAFASWRNQALKLKLVVIEIGAGNMLGNIRILSQSLPGTLIRINPRDSGGPPGTLSIALPALSTLTAIDEAIDSLSLG